MEIIFVTSALHGGGAERVMATLANQYAQQGDEVTILMTAGDEVMYHLHPKIKLVCLGMPSHGDLREQLKRLFRMRAYFRAHKNSRIVSFSTTINLFTILASLGLKNRVIVSERNDPNRCSYRKLRNGVYRLCQNFVFQTEDARRCFPKRIQKNSVVIPNPIRSKLPEPVTDGESESHTLRENKIAAVGRLEQQKNHRLLLQAFAGFCKKFPEWELHLFGQGSLEDKLRQQAKELGIERQVIFEGFRNDVLECIRSYGMYVLSSDYEGISNSLMEAMALGLACISTDCPIGGSALCIQNGENGLLVPVGDAEAFQKAMEQLAGDKKRAAKLGKSAVSVRDRFSEEVIAEKWHQYISGEVSV